MECIIADKIFFVQNKIAQFFCSQSAKLQRILAGSPSGQVKLGVQNFLLSRQNIV